MQRGFIHSVRTSTSRLRRVAVAATLASLLIGVTAAYACTGSLTSVTVSGCTVTVKGAVVRESGVIYDLKAVAQAPTVGSQTPGQQVYFAPLSYTSSYTQTVHGHKYTFDTFAISLGPANGLLQGGKYKILLVANQAPNGVSGGLNHATVTVGSCPVPPRTPTPELGSGELLATGLLPVAGIMLYRRRRGAARVEPRA